MCLARKADRVSLYIRELMDARILVDKNDGPRVIRDPADHPVTVLLRTKQLQPVDDGQIEIAVPKLFLVFVDPGTCHGLDLHAVQVVVEILDQQIGGFIEGLARHPHCQHLPGGGRGLEGWRIRLLPIAGTGRQDEDRQPGVVDQRSSFGSHSILLEMYYNMWI